MNVYILSINSPISQHRQSQHPLDNVEATLPVIQDLGHEGLLSSIWAIVEIEPWILLHLLIVLLWSI